MRGALLPLGAVLAATLVVGGFFGVHSPPARSGNVPQQTPVAAATPATSPSVITSTTIEEPKLLEIKTANVEISTPVEDIFQVNGVRGTPTKPNVVGWCKFRCSAPPGWPGDLLIVGHYDDAQGRPAVFYHLSALTPGNDEITLTTASGKRFTYVVDTVENRPYVAGTDALTLAGAGQPSRMVLETCAGMWDGPTYNKRTIVTAHQLPN